MPGLCKDNILDLFWVSGQKFKTLASSGPGQGLADLKDGSNPLFSFVFKSSPLISDLITQASLKRAGEVFRVIRTISK